MAITTVYNELIAENAISGTLIADNAITATHIATNAVSGVIVADNAITTVHIAQNNVTSTSIVANAITSTQLADNAVTATKIPDGTALTLGATRVNGDFTVGASSGEDKLVIAPQSAGSGTIVISYNDAGNAYEPYRVDAENFSFRPSGTEVLGLTASDASFSAHILAKGGHEVRAYRSGDSAYGSMFMDTGENLYIRNSWGTKDLVFNRDGKLLIGDSASHTSDFLQIETPASGGGHGIQIRRNDANTDQGIGHILFGNNTATDLVKISAKTDGDSNAGDSGALLFHTQVTGGNLTERMRIDSDGKVMIGTTTEGRAGEGADMLTIGATSNNSGLTMRSGTSGYGSIYFSDGTSGTDEYKGYLQYGHATDVLHMGAGGSVVMNLIGGKVAIGSNFTPAYALHVEKGEIAALISRSGSGTNSFQNAMIIDAKTSNDAADGFGPALYFTFTDSGVTRSEIANISVIRDGADNSGQLQFGVRNAGTWDYDAMVIDSTSKVGIGNTSPSSMYSTTNNLVIGDSGNSGMTIKSTSGIGTISFADGTSGSERYRGQIAYSHSGDSLRFNTAAAEGMRLDGNNLFLNGGTDARIQLGSGGAGANTVSNDTVHIRGDGDSMKLMAAADGLFIFEINGSEKMRIDTGGNIGMTIVPEAWNTDFRVVQMGTGGSSVFGGATSNRNVGLGQNSYLSTGGDWKYTQADHAGLLTGYDGTWEIDVAGSGSADATISWTTAVKVLNSGYVGINETAPIRRLEVSGASGSGCLILGHMQADTAGGICGLQFKADSTNDDRRIKGSILFVRDDPGTRGTGVLHICNNGANSDTNVSASDNKLSFYANGVAAFHNVYAEAASPIVATAVMAPGFQIGNSTVSGALGIWRTNTDEFKYYHNEIGYIMTFTSTGTMSGDFVDTSDVNLKENISTIADGTSVIKALRPVKFDWKASAKGDNQHGFIAQEVETALPTAVSGNNYVENATGHPDDEPADNGKTINSKAVLAHAVKAIQELEARIATLEG